MMNSNDQPQHPGSLDFQPRRANDKAMLSRLGNVENDLAAVRTTVEVMRSNYVTKEDLALEVAKINEKIAKVNENTAAEFGQVHGKIAKLNESMMLEFAKVNDYMVREFAKVNDYMVREFAKVNDTMVREFAKSSEFTVRETGKANQNTSDLRAEMHKEFHAQTWRIVGAVVVLCSSLTAAVYFIARNVH